jgi:hypothetical protein
MAREPTLHAASFMLVLQFYFSFPKAHFIKLEKYSLSFLDSSSLSPFSVSGLIAVYSCRDRTKPISSGYQTYCFAHVVNLGCYIEHSCKKEWSKTHKSC